MMRYSQAFLFSVLISVALPACAASPNPSSAGSKPKAAVLLRTFFVPLRADVPLGPKHPPLDRFQESGFLAGGQDGKAQLGALASRYTLSNLAYQYSDVKPMAEMGETVLEMGFGEEIQVKVANLTQVKGGPLTADFTITFGQRELIKRQIPFKEGDCVLFAGHLEASLPILSVFSVEIRRFPADQIQAYDDFLQLARKDSEAFAPPPPQQRSQEPYLPGVGDVSMPELLSRNNAIYPDAAKPDRMEGQVIVEVVVDKEGKTTNPRVITPPSIFDYSALDAAVTYRYKPAMKNGQPVSVTMNIIILFKYTIRPT
ncbi:MAG: energy transducer TonB [Acidobacteria bacterium]|nr:energy transducer TonB [Acidobacteriota bacterium]MCI0569028.1 energy transducer TonB [Acidobacteriota bacterium]